MRKLFTFLLMLALVMSLCACSGNQTPPPTDPSQNARLDDTSTPEDPSTSPTEAASASDTLRRFYDSRVTTDAQVDEPRLVSSDSDQGVTALRFQTPRLGYYQYGNGLFTTCADEVEMQQGSHYNAYHFDGETITPLENHSFYQEYTLYGQTYRVRFDYASWGDRILSTYNPDDYYDPTDVGGFATSLSDHSCLIALNEPVDDGFLLHLKVLDLETGELTDYIPDLNPEVLSEKLKFESYSIRRMIVRDTGALLIGPNWEYRYIQAQEGLVVDLSELIGGKVAMGTVVFAGEDLLCRDEEDGIWKIDTTDFTSRLLLSDKKLLHFNGSTFALYAEEDEVYVYDCISETDTCIQSPEGWDLTKIQEFSPSNDGRKVYVYTRPDKTTEKILTFNCDTMEFTEITATVPEEYFSPIIYYTEDDDLSITRGLTSTTVYKIE